MSVTASPPTDTVSPPPAPGEACPLCGAPLHPEQEWCVRCGAAARTRLAAAPNWKKPIAALAVIVALSLGVIAAALIALAGNSTTTAGTINTVTAPAAAVAPAQTTPAPSATPTIATTPQTTAPANTAPAGSAAGPHPSGAGHVKLHTTVHTGSVFAKRLAKTPGAPQTHIKLSPKVKAEIRRALAKTAP